MSACTYVCTVRSLFICLLASFVNSSSRWGRSGMIYSGSARHEYIIRTGF